MVVRVPVWTRGLVASATILSWAALTLQLYLSIVAGLANGRGLLGSLSTYFSFFTILTNILVALALTVSAVGANGWLGRFFMRTTVVTAIAAYISMVGIAYNLLLRQLWEPQGLQFVADVILHDVMPVLFLLYWWMFTSAQRWRLADVVRWSYFPLGYLTCALLRGAWVGSYPYPFIDVGLLGYTHVLLNAAGLLLGFLGIAWLLIMTGRTFKPTPIYP